MTSENLKKSNERGKSGPWIISTILASALLVSYYQWNRHTTQTTLYTEVMKSYKLPVNNLAPGISSNSTVVDEAVKEFERQNYDMSYTLFKSIEPKSDSIFWYLGHISLINGKVYEAKNHSKKISDQMLKSELQQYVDRII